VATWDELRSGSEAMSAPAAVHAHAHAAEPAAAAPVGDAEAGRHLYATTCAACHGTDAQGIHGLGKDLTASIFLASLDDAGVVEFLKQGRDSSDPLNTTGVAMPPKAGNPALTDEDLRNITAFLRTGSEHEDAAVNGALGGVETQEEGSGASNTGHQHGGGAAGGDAANLQHRHCGGNGPAGNSPGQGHMHRMRHGHS
jgi:disulfide bond formation protein DsbB